MRLFAGIDVGSTATKAVLVDENEQVAGRGLADSAADFAQAAAAAYAAALAEAGAGRGSVERVISTGYGRDNVTFATGRRTEIDCHAKGAYHEFPRAIIVVDIGGQDNKIIQLDQVGNRISFSMNRKCAAGTGSFLEEMGLRLKVPLDQLGHLASESTDHEVSIGSYCTVFAMTEILSKIRAGVKPADLARASLVSVARRVLEAHPFSGEVVATGGVVAHIPLMREILAESLGAQVLVPDHAQHTGALGAALTAARGNTEDEA